MKISLLDGFYPEVLRDLGINIRQTLNLLFHWDKEGH